MRAKGFTLIEILVVLIIIGITIGFALLSFGDFGASRRAVVSAEQFANYIKLTQHRAILEMTPLGITINKENFQTFRFEQNVWKPMVEKTIFRTQYFPSNITVNLQRMHTITKNPDIIISASGDITPFSLDFGTNQKPKLATVVGKPNGIVTVLLPRTP
ncbi:type II secretion system minor pseudopilin GspH [Legionella cardiaca]|uniref:Type II secretion system protein H n=1 Tax=Legionella cardiaca TaxID=1071983 RepID=A0ABY8AWR4_9GAMM|nr:type II secretion system minor pseudopilin GspH [Legionella cardiaca]WED44184.1 type II secretion system minor pseudopilin GspH [Legionella cardiaca]